MSGLSARTLFRVPCLLSLLPSSSIFSCPYLLSHPVSFYPFLFPLCSLSVEVGGLGERCQLPQRFPGLRSGRIRIVLSIIALQKPHLLTPDFVFLLCEKNKHHNFGRPRPAASLPVSVVTPLHLKSRCCSFVRGFSSFSQTCCANNFADLLYSK